jgi:hypothetical protein
VRVKFTRPYQLEGQDYQAGQEADLPDDQAARAIDDAAAELAEDDGGGGGGTRGGGRPLKGGTP